MTLLEAFETWKTRPGAKTVVPLLEASRAAVHALCNQVLHHDQDAEDASQAVLLQILDHLPQIQDAGHFRAFLQKTCFHVSLNLKRSRRRRLDHERVKAEQVDSAAPMPDETADAIHEHLARLDDATRSLVVGRYFERRTIQELAADAGCSTTSIGKRLEKAREELLQSLSRVGVALTAQRLDAFFASVVPASAPTGPLCAAILARALRSWAPAVAGAAMKTKAPVLLLLVAMAGVGLLVVSTIGRPPVEPPLAAPEASSRRSASARTAPEPDSSATPTGSADSRQTVAPPPPDTEGYLMASLKAFMRNQNPDGSWGDGVAPLDGRLVDPVGVTALAMLAFSGAGYVYHSKDTCDDMAAGPTVRRSYEWLQKRQRLDGTFLTSGEEAITQALGTLALSEFYGLTATDLMKDRAQRAVAALLKMQREDGSWGNATTSLWAAEALRSAALCELAIDPNALARSQQFYRSQLDAGPNLPAMIGHLFLSRDSTHPALRQTSAWISAVPPEANRPEFMYWYMGSMALFQLDGPEGPIWKQWNEPFKQALYSTQQKDGLWHGGTRSATIVQSSLASLSLEVYYRYERVTDPKPVQK